MMGRTHALSGWCAGLAVAPFLGLETLAQVTPFAATVAGFALLPDLDHPSSRASRIAGPITGGLSKVLRASSARLYKATKGRRDERIEGKHRHMTHTLVFALLLGALTVGATSVFGVGSVVVVLLMGLILAIDALGAWLLAVPAVVAIGVFASDNPMETLQIALHPSPLVLGTAVALGCLTHCLGDSITLAGCPWLWPIPILGETWYELRPPRWLRFRAGGKVESWVVFPAFTVIGVLLLPGVWPQLLHMVGAKTA